MYSVVGSKAAKLLRKNLQQACQRMMRWTSLVHDGSGPDGVFICSKLVRRKEKY